MCARPETLVCKCPKYLKASLAATGSFAKTRGCYSETLILVLNPPSKEMMVNIKSSSRIMIQYILRRQHNSLDTLTCLSIQKIWFWHAARLTTAVNTRIRLRMLATLKISTRPHAIIFCIIAKQLRCRINLIACVWHQHSLSRVWSVHEKSQVAKRWQGRG